MTVSSTGKRRINLYLNSNLIELMQKSLEGKGVSLSQLTEQLYAQVIGRGILTPEGEGMGQKFPETEEELFESYGRQIFFLTAEAGKVFKSIQERKQQETEEKPETGETP